MSGKKHVSKDSSNSQNGKKRLKPYKGMFRHKGVAYYCGWHENEKDAQIAVDIKRISLGLKPNFLKPKP